MEDLFNLINAVEEAGKQPSNETEQSEDVEGQEVIEPEGAGKHPISSHMELVIDKKVERRLGYVYENIPNNNCQRCAECCFNVPQVHFIEFMNIMRAINQLPEEKKNAITRKTIQYELFNLATLEHQCPFLDEKDCLIYDARPLQCRIFALYPDSDYKANMESSKAANEQVMEYFCKEHSIKLPQEVLSFDIEQCGNNLDPDGKPIIINEFERMALVNRIKVLEADVIPYEIDAKEAYTSFSYLFMQLFFDEEIFMKLKIKCTEEHLTSGNSETPNELIEELLFPDIL